jgi:two-component system, LytTR family, response regulator AlgR
MDALERTHTGFSPVGVDSPVHARAITHKELPTTRPMRPMRIVIADDESSSRSLIERRLGELEPAFDHTVLATAERGRDALAACRRETDILIIDPNISEINGIEVARELLKRPRAPRVIFVSKDDRHALTAFEVQAVDYLLKPVQPERLLQALERARPVESPVTVGMVTGARRFFSSSEHGRMLLVPAEDVLYLRAEFKYLTVVTAEREYLLEGSLDRVEQEFGEHFVRLRRNMLARADLIESLKPDHQIQGETEWIVTLRGCGVALPVSRRQLKNVRSLARRVFHGG